MKLSKQQVEAIASKIVRQVVDPINKHNNEVKLSKEYIDFESTNKDCIEINRICKEYDDTYHSRQIAQKIKDTYFKDRFIKSPSFGYNNVDIINDIILGTIEYDNLDELINKLSEKYANA